MKEYNSFLYPKGSEWRKWDLHIHTKSDSNYTFSSDNRISIKERDDNEYPKVFIEHIYKINNLGAITITDHNKADWVDKILIENDRYSQTSRCNKITIFPGVEIESGDGIHILVIFNPETQIQNVISNFRKSSWKDTIDHFLTAIKNSANPNTHKTTEEILEEAEKWDALCVFAHTASDKGFFKISSGDRKTKIYKHSLTQIFEIPPSGLVNVGYKNIVYGKDPNYSSKSVALITSSDAKKLEDIGTNNLWIKADPTFEGLKQIIYEPEERVYIGEEPPYKIERDKIIRAITISNSKKWFKDDESIPVNEGLVSIIGGKGSGKTAVLDLIAYSTKSYKSYEEDEGKSKSFLKRAYRELKDTKIKVEWEDGNIDELIISDKLQDINEAENPEPKVRYLPQDFIDQLCTAIGKSEIEEQIENVIFQKIPEEDKASFTNFRDYKENYLNLINNKKNKITKQIEELNLKIFECNKLIKLEDNKKIEIKKIESDIKKFEQEMKKISDVLRDSKKQQGILEQLNSYVEQKSGLEKIISDLNAKLRKTEEIQAKIDDFIEYSENFIKGLETDFKVIEISQKDIKINVTLYFQDIKKRLDSRKKEIEDKIKEQKDKLSKLNKTIQELNSRIEIEKSKQDKIKEISKSLSELKKSKDFINNDIKKIENTKNILIDLLDKQKKLFVNYFELIFQEKEKLKQIYSPLESFLKGSSEENEKLFEFAVKFNFDTEFMAKEGDRLIDHTKEGRFWRKDWQALCQEIEKQKFSLNLENTIISDIDKNSINNFCESIKNLLSIDEKGKRYEIESQLRKEYTEQDLLNWLYSTKYYSIKYSIKFNGSDLNNLSPGLKGVALLILFLELDENDKRPILIDQPEENLDNRSIYGTLVRYFRKAKKRRQVIIATHNPNLVVNTDSEQVIVANFAKDLEKQSSKISYISGSLENTFKNTSIESILEKQGIREHVCEILEGGEEAFKKRENRYQIK